MIKIGRWGDEEKQGEQPQARIIGEISVESATFEVHDGAIYMHEGETYRVDQLDLEQRIASVTPVNVDFYTATDGEMEVEVLQVHAERHSETAGQWISTGGWCVPIRGPVFSGGA